MNLLLEAWFREYQKQRVGKRNLKMGSPSRNLVTERALKEDARPYRNPMPKGWDEGLQKARIELTKLNRR